MLSGIQWACGELGYQRNKKFLHDVLKTLVEVNNADSILDGDSEQKFKDYVQWHGFGGTELMFSRK